MAYQIRYGASIRDVKRRSSKIWAVALIVLSLITALSLLDGAEVQSWLLPGDPLVTSAALEGLQADLRAGESMVDAVTAFCREIVDGAAAAG